MTWKKKRPDTVPVYDASAVLPFAPRIRDLSDTKLYLPDRKIKSGGLDSDLVVYGDYRRWRELMYRSVISTDR